MENDDKSSSKVITSISKNWSRKRKSPSRDIAVSQPKMLLYHWPRPFLLDFGPWRDLLRLMEQEPVTRLFRLKMQQSSQVAWIAKAIKNLKGIRALNWDFHYNRKMNDDALALLGRKLDVHKKLQNFQLNVSCCKEIGDKGILYIMRRMSRVLKIKNFVLVARECEGITNPGLRQLSIILSKFPLKSLQLDLRNCCMITDESITPLSQNLSSLTSLTSLDLSFSEYRNSFKVNDTVIKSLAKSISKLTGLIKLQLDFNYQQKITNQGFLPLCESFEKLTKLILLRLEFSNAKIDDEGIKSLSEKTSKIETLKYLQLDFSENLNLTEETARMITSNFEEIKSKLKLFQLVLKNCPKVGEKGREMLEKFINEVNHKISTNTKTDENKTTTEENKITTEEKPT